MHNIYDFKEFRESRMKITNNMRFIRYEKNNSIKFYERVNDESNEFSGQVDLMFLTQQFLELENCN